MADSYGISIILKGTKNWRFFLIFFVKSINLPAILRDYYGHSLSCVNGEWNGY